MTQKEIKEGMVRMTGDLNYDIFDLNACHEWEEKLTSEQKRDHGSILMEMCHNDLRKFGAIYATALQRCEARMLMEGE
jgi:hypothetical protein